MPPPDALDATDARLLLALDADPRATAVALADHLALSRNTVRARLASLERRGALGSFERRIEPAALGYPLTAIVITRVTQQRLGDVASALERIPEVLEVRGISGEVDLLVHVVGVDADDLYRVAGAILAIDGVERTTTSLVMRSFVDYRVAPLLHRLADA